MRSYYETPVQANLVVAAGTSKVFAIKFPTRTRLTKLNIIQTNTPAVTFSVDLFNKSVGDTPAANNADDLWLLNTPGGIPSNSAGVLVYRFADYDTYFINQDTDQYLASLDWLNRPADSYPNMTVPANTNIINPSARRVIYIRITNTGANSATFSLILGSEYLGS